MFALLAHLTQTLYLFLTHTIFMQLPEDWRKTNSKASYFFLPLYIFSVLTQRSRLLNSLRVVFAYIGTCSSQLSFSERGLYTERPRPSKAVKFFWAARLQSRFEVWRKKNSELQRRFFLTEKLSPFFTFVLVALLSLTPTSDYLSEKQTSI